MNRQARLIALITTLCVIGCAKSHTSNQPLITPTGLGGLEVVQFKNEETESRMKKLDQCINEMIDSDWTIVPYDITGENEYGARWCVGSGTSALRLPCDDSDLFHMYDHDQHMIHLFTDHLHFPEY